MCMFFFPLTAKIGSLNFKVIQNEDKTKMEVHIQDPQTAIKKNGRPMTIREIFREDLMYKVQYSKAGSTGKVSLLLSN